MLQAERVFTNVSKGMFAKIEDIRKHLTASIRKAKNMTDDELERAAVQLILDTGVMQLNEFERKQEMEGLLQDVANTIASKCVNPDTGRPYPVGMILAALNKIGYAPNNRKSSKMQALDGIRQLVESDELRIQRAPMLLRASVTMAYAPVLLAFLQEQDGARVIKASNDVVDFLTPPDRYRDIDAVISKGGSECSLQVIANVVTEDGDGKLSYEVERPQSVSESVNSLTKAPPSPAAKKKGKNRKLQSSSEDEAPLEDKSHKAKRQEKKKKHSLAEAVTQLSSDEDTSKRGKRGKKNKKGKHAMEPIADTAQSSDDEDTSKRGKRGKKAKAKGKSETTTTTRAERKRKEKEIEEEEYGVSEVQRRKEEQKKLKDEQDKTKLLADPNYYESDEFGSDYDDFYKDEAEDKTLEEIHEEKLAKKKALEEAEALRLEDAEKQTVRTSATRKKRRRNKKGEFIDTDDEEEAGEKEDDI